MAVSQKWQRFWGSMLGGAAGGAVLVATNNLGVVAGVGIGGAAVAVGVLAVIYAVIAD